MKKFLGWSIIVLLFSGGLFFYYQIFLRSNPPQQPATPSPLTTQQTKPIQVSGKIFSIINKPPIITIESTPSNINILLINQTKIFSMSSQPLEFGSLQKGFTIKAAGNKLPNNSIIAETINVTDSPPLIIYQPSSGTIISDSISVEGIATKSASLLHYRLTNSRNKAIYLDDKITLSKKPESFYTPFQINLKLPQKISTVRQNDSLTLEIDLQPLKKGSTPQIINLIYQSK